MSVWKTLSEIDVSSHIEKKGQLSYLSWAWAWGELKNRYPCATYEKHYFDHQGMSVPYAVDLNGYAFVMVSVTVEGLTHTETLPVLNHQNKAVNAPDSFQINTSLQRCLAKAIAMHGLGHYIYAGEDLPNVVPIDKGEIEAFGARMREALEENDFVTVGRSLIEDQEIWQTANQGTQRNGGQFDSKHKKLQSDCAMEYRDQLHGWAADANALVESDAIDDLMELVSDIDNDTDKPIFWAALNARTQNIIREQLKEKAA